MKLIKTQDAVGHVLCHDMTQIIQGSYKDARFRKGHVVTESDIPILLSMGKENLYVWEMIPGMIHENLSLIHIWALFFLAEKLLTQPKTLPLPAAGPVPFWQLLGYAA